MLLSDPEFLLRIEKGKAAPFKFIFRAKGYRFDLEKKDTNPISEFYLRVDYYDPESGKLNKQLRMFLFNRILNNH